MNLILGQYYPAESFVHRLDPRTKINSVILYIIAVFLANNILGYVICGLMLLLIFYLSKIPLRLCLKSLKSIFVIIIFTVIFNLVLIRTGEVWFEFGIIKITSDGAKTTAELCVRLMLLVVGSGFLTFTTTPLNLCDGIERLIRPICFGKVSSQEIAMMMSIALRFIPTLSDELNKIRKAQIARGADFESGGLINRAKALLPLLVPLFVSSFRRADELAMAMESRCYSSEIRRSRLHELSYGKKDMLAYAVMLMFTLCVFVSRFAI